MIYQKKKNDEDNLIMMIDSRKALYNRELININDSIMSHPYKECETIMIPLKFTLVKLGGSILWDHGSQKTTVRMNGKDAYWSRNQNFYIKNGKKYNFNNEIRIVDEITFISLEDFKKITGIEYKVVKSLILFTSEKIRDFESVSKKLNVENHNISLNILNIQDEKNLWLKDNFLVAHALGEIDRYTYTNSLEAFIESYSNGIRIFEVDLMLTSDKKLVLRHDWGNDWFKEFKQEEKISLEKKDTVLDLESFDKLKIYDNYTPLSFNDLIILMNKYKDIKVIIDT